MATSAPPPRRFRPEPIETSIKSSRSSREPSDPSSSSALSEGKSTSSNTGASMTSTVQPRRFLPQPVEESKRSSHKKINHEHVEDSTTTPKDGPPLDAVVVSLQSPPEDPTPPAVANNKPPRRFAPEPIESSLRSSRRKFAPEPIETSTRRSKDKDNPPAEETNPKPRRKFAPEPVETTARSSKEKKKDAEEASVSKPRRKFVPEPIETTSTTNRRRQASLDETSEDEPPNTGGSSTSSRASTGPRKFSPELLETAKGSYRRFHPHTPDTSVSPAPSRREYSPPPIEEDPTCEELPEPEEQSRFSAAALAKKHPENQRQHSFAIPDLPIIESTSEDEEYELPPLIESSSSGSDARKARPQLSAKDSYTEYVLRLATEPVSKRELQEQAMAAYINEIPHQPVDHFANDHDEDEDGPLPSPVFQGEKGADVRLFRRSSAEELRLEMDSMRKHQEQLDAMKREFKADTAGQSRFSAAALATRHALETKGLTKPKKPRPEDEDTEMARIRAAASPPMLGTDIVFPYTISPKMTRCDPDQAPRPRTAESDDGVPLPNSPELWKARLEAENNTGGGLWMGVCQAGGLWQPQSPKPGRRSGIQTPSPGTPVESTTPGRGSRTPGARTPGRRRAPFPASQSVLPMTPPRSQDGEDMFTSTIDKKLFLEKQIEDEFPTRVITQIYNYLSLGYPSLAHLFDDELSKIARIPIEELRKDDNHVDAKGYIGVPEGDGWEESEVVGRCKRWEALRIYIKEWARQSPGFADGRRAALGANDDWGARARRGSWNR